MEVDEASAERLVKELREHFDQSTTQLKREIEFLAQQQRVDRENLRLHLDSGFAEIRNGTRDGFERIERELERGFDRVTEEVAGTRQEISTGFDKIESAIHRGIGLLGLVVGAIGILISVVIAVAS